MTAPPARRKSDSDVVTVMNGKGGVGKTHTVLTLAAHVGASHGRALVVDADSQATAYDLTQVLADPGYEIVHETDPAKLTKLSQLRDFDMILVDTPGLLEGHNKFFDEVLSRSTFVLIPFDHTPEAYLPTVRTVETIRKAGVPHAVVLTKADPRRGTGYASFIDDARNMLDRQQIPYFRTVIRSYQAWPNSVLARVPITRWNERNAPRARQDIASLHSELQITLGRLGPERSAR